MIGRGAYGRPWLLGQVMHWLRTGERLPDPSMDEQYQVITEQYDAMLDHYGEVIGAIAPKAYRAGTPAAFTARRNSATPSTRKPTRGGPRRCSAISTRPGSAGPPPERQRPFVPVMSNYIDRTLNTVKVRSSFRSWRVAMRKTYLIAFALAACTVTLAPALAVQTINYPQSGSDVTSVTVNYDNRTITYHYANGFQYTPANIGFRRCGRLFAQQRQRREPEGEP
jgi:hypothetical protein